MRRPRKQLSRKERQAKRRAEWKKDHPTFPFENWDDSYVREIEAVIGDREFTWNKDGIEHHRQRLTTFDLAIGLWAVCCTAPEDVRAGLSLNRLAVAFKVVRPVGCHRNKASAILRTLTELGLITRIGNHFGGFTGRRYRRLLPGEIPPPPPVPIQRSEKQTVDSTPNDSTDDPWS